METKSGTGPELAEAPSVIAKEPKNWPNAPDPNFFAATSVQGASRPWSHSKVSRKAFLKQNPGEAPLPTDGDDVFRAMDKQKGVSTTTRLRHVLRPFLTLADWGCIDKIYLDVHIYYLFIFRLWQLTVASHSYNSYFHPQESNFGQKITPDENTPKRKNNNTTAETNQQVTPRPHVPGKSMIPDHIAQRSKARRYK